MVSVMRDIRRHEAKMIAEELFALIKNECKKASISVAEAGQEQYLNIKEAAALTGWAVSTLYKKKDDIGCYTKVGKHLMFSKSGILQLIKENRL